MSHSATPKQISYATYYAEVQRLCEQIKTNPHAKLELVQYIDATITKVKYVTRKKRFDTYQTTYNWIKKLGSEFALSVTTLHKIESYLQKHAPTMSTLTFTPKTTAPKTPQTTTFTPKMTLTLIHPDDCDNTLDKYESCTSTPAIYSHVVANYAADHMGEDVVVSTTVFSSTSGGKHKHKHTTTMTPVHYAIARNDEGPTLYPTISTSTIAQPMQTSTQTSDDLPSWYILMGIIMYTYLASVVLHH